MLSNPNEVVCDGTIAKYMKISVAGESIPLYLVEVEEVGYSEAEWQSYYS